MEDWTCREEPGEIVEVYRQTREVVETYVRPLPGRSAARKRSALPAVSRKRRKKTGLWVFLLLTAAAVGLTVGAYLWDQALPEPDWRPYFDNPYGQDRDTAGEEITIPAYPVGEGAVLEVKTGHGPELSPQEVYRQVNPAVVTVIVQLRDGASVGTGVIFSGDGYVLTNYHVLEGGRDCTITLDSGRSYEAQYVAGDQENDLAVLKADLTDLPQAEFGDSDELTVGDKVYAIGNPLGVELRGTLTDGIVSAINRDVRVDERTMTLIQTNAALNSGNSGGPLVNAYGQVVGINTIKMSSAYSNIEGLGFAIPSASIRYLVNDLLTYGEVRPEPLLGISVSQTGTMLGEDLWGIEVLEVTAGSAADLAGVRAGDFVTAAGGVEVSASKDLLRARRQFQIGDEMPMTLWRDGEVLDVTLELFQEAE